MTNKHRIDVHQHVVPPFYADELPGHGGDPSGAILPVWVPEDALAFMDSQGIDAALLSLTPPGVASWYKMQRRSVARGVNDFVSRMVDRWPTRFGNLATIPLPDVVGSLREIRYAFDELNADGIAMFSSYRGRYLGDRAFDAVWAELDRYQATVLVYPCQPPCPALPGMMGTVIDYPFDTTRTAIHMVLNGVLERYPNVRVILSDGGGFVPYVADRAAHLAATFSPEVLDAKKVLSGLQSFHFDTSLIGANAMPSLKQFAGIDRILFGSAYPFAPLRTATAFAQSAREFGGFSEEDLAAVFRKNAQSLFPRLAARLDERRSNSTRQINLEPESG